MSEDTRSLEHLETWAGLLDSAAETVWPVSRTEIEPGDALAVASSAMRVRVSRLLRACGLLVRAGYSIEIAGLVRSIWEDALSAAYMAESPGDRPQQWIDYSELRRVHHLKQALLKPESIVGDDTLPMIEQAVEGLESSKSHYWTGQGPSAVAKSLVDSSDKYRALLGRDFDIYYQALCDDTHGSPFAVGQLLSAGEDAACVDAGPIPSRTGELAPLALYGAWQFAQALSGAGVDVNADELKSVLEDVQSRMRAAAGALANQGIEWTASALD